MTDVKDGTSVGQAAGGSEEGSAAAEAGGGQEAAWTERTQLLLGEANAARLAAAHVLVVGLGGVGAWAAEMIVRAGVGAMTIVDADTVSASNINRQLPALHSTVGRAKTEVMAARLKDINPSLRLTALTLYVKDEQTDLLLDGLLGGSASGGGDRSGGTTDAENGPARVEPSEASSPTEAGSSREARCRSAAGGNFAVVRPRLAGRPARSVGESGDSGGTDADVTSKPRFDYVVDAIDTLAPKVNLIKGCLDRGIPLVSSMGAGAKTDPTLVEIRDISKTHHCPLAHMLRKRLHRLGIRRGFTAVFSPEEVRAGSMIMVEEANKKSNVGTVSYMPAVFGCHCASVVIRGLIGELGATREIDHK